MRDHPPPTRRVLALVLAAAAAWPAALSAQGLADDPFASHVLGDWHGEGEYQGSRLELTRRWTLELGEQFLEADMRVTMANGGSFGSLTYWKPDGDGIYRVLWLDGTGRMQTLQALRDPETGVVSTTFLDEATEGGPEWRRWEFHATGEDSYVERLFAQTASGWKVLAELTFRRDEAP